jgi:L,D-transpeptidase ErfK/SrfK
LSKSGYLIHGTNKPASIGLNATNGCLRLYPENMERLYQETPVNTPVMIVQQPYLLGQRDGVLYLEAHRPLEGSEARELERLHATLTAIEKTSARPLDWHQIREVQAAARGIPVPILLRAGAEEQVAEAIEVTHPGGNMYGRPQIPELQLDAWYVLAGEVGDEREARRMAAMINHQGPPIPARALAKGAKNTGYRVIAGPFEHVGAAQNAVRRLKIDLDLDGLIIEPIGKVLEQPMERR